MENLLINELNCATVTVFGKRAGGCISQGEGYITDAGERFFVKQNSKPGAKEMFIGELEGLKALGNTGCVKCPKPCKVFDLPHGGAALAVEYLVMELPQVCAAALGENLAKLHLHNRSKITESADKQHAGDGLDKQTSYIDKYGFSVTTCCGYLSQDNTWTDDWPTFYTTLRLQKQIDRAASERNDTELFDLWLKLQPKVPHFFRGLDIFPSLLHGDLWSANVASVNQETHAAEPVIFDPAAVYGHHEFDLANWDLTKLGELFYSAYHKIIPKADGFDSRQELYQLYYYLNQYNHFGSKYRNPCVRLLEELSRMSLD